MKRLSILLFIAVSCIASVTAQQTVLMRLSADSNVRISKDIYGQFAEHLGRSVYDGFWHNGAIRTDIVAALRRIHIPNLRWPGGCFADQYHWRDGIGDPAKRPARINVTWGMVPEDNRFGTAEFLDLCAQIGCAPYIAGNVGTGTPQEMKDWVEYLNLRDSSSLAKERRAGSHAAPYRVALWGVGNESWGCGGNMRAEYYADLYNHFAAFLPNYPGAPLRKIISGPNAGDYHWTEVMMQQIHPENAWGLSMHYYTLPTGNWDHKGSATSFDEKEYAHTLQQALKMEELVTRHSAIMDKYDPARKIALLVDEWGVWADVEPGTPDYAMYQQNSLRDALVAASTLNIFNNHAGRVRGANLAQTVNVIHSLILTRGDSMLLTPTYHVFDLYQVHQDAMLIPLEFQSPVYTMGADTVRAVNASASRDSAGLAHVSLVNLDPHHAMTVRLPIKGSRISGRVLTSAKTTDINTFAVPNKVSIQSFTGFKRGADGVEVTLPAKSVVMLELAP